MANKPKLRWVMSQSFLYSGKRCIGSVSYIGRGGEKNYSYLYSAGGWDVFGYAATFEEAKAAVEEEVPDGK